MASYVSVLNNMQAKQLFEPLPKVFYKDYHY